MSKHSFPIQAHAFHRKCEKAEEALLHPRIASYGAHGIAVTDEFSDELLRGLPKIEWPGLFPKHERYLEHWKQVEGSADWERAVTVGIWCARIQLTHLGKWGYTITASSRWFSNTRADDAKFVLVNTDGNRHIVTSRSLDGAKKLAMLATARALTGCHLPKKWKPLNNMSWDCVESPDRWAVCLTDQRFDCARIGERNKRYEDEGTLKLTFTAATRNTKYAPLGTMRKKAGCAIRQFAFPQARRRPIACNSQDQDVRLQYYNTASRAQ